MLWGRNYNKKIKIYVLQVSNLSSRGRSLRALFKDGIIISTWPFACSQTVLVLLCLILLAAKFSWVSNDVKGGPLFDFSTEKKGNLRVFVLLFSVLYYAFRRGFWVLPKIIRTCCCNPVLGFKWKTFEQWRAMHLWICHFAPVISQSFFKYTLVHSSTLLAYLYHVRVY